MSVWRNHRIDPQKPPLQGEMQPTLALHCELHRSAPEATSFAEAVETHQGPPGLFLVHPAQDGSRTAGRRATLDVVGLVVRTRLLLFLTSIVRYSVGTALVRRSAKSLYTLRISLRVFPWLGVHGHQVPRLDVLRLCRSIPLGHECAILGTLAQVEFILVPVVSLLHIVGRSAMNRTALAFIIGRAWKCQRVTSMSQPNRFSTCVHILAIGSQRPMRQRLPQKYRSRRCRTRQPGIPVSERSNISPRRILPMNDLDHARRASWLSSALRRRNNNPSGRTHRNPFVPRCQPCAQLARFFSVVDTEVGSTVSNRASGTPGRIRQMGATRP